LQNTSRPATDVGAETRWIKEADLKTEQEIKEWLENGGIELLAEAAERAAEAAEKYFEAAQVDPATLDKPVTI